MYACVKNEASTEQYCLKMTSIHCQQGISFMAVRTKKEQPEVPALKSIINVLTIYTHIP